MDGAGTSHGDVQLQTGRDAELDAILLDEAAAAQAAEYDASLRPRITAVIPTLNEEANLPYVLPLLSRYADEIIVVDGHSTDQTVPTAQSLCPDVNIVLHETRGKGAALRRGFEAATGDVIVMIDADGSNDPREIPRFVGALVSGADFAKGSRFLLGGGTTDMPWYRRLGNTGFIWLVRLLFGPRYSDLCYGYNAFWRDAIPGLLLDGDGFEIETMINVRAARAGLRIVEVPSFEAERIHGASNLQTIRDGWRVLKTILHERFRATSVARPDRRWTSLVELEPQLPTLEVTALTPEG